MTSEKSLKRSLISPSNSAPEKVNKFRSVLDQIIHILLCQVARSEDNTENETCGIIKKIRLVDFMCHELFEWSPNSNVNLLIGANGSGKSSVLQGKTPVLLLNFFSFSNLLKVDETLNERKYRATINTPCLQGKEGAGVLLASSSVSARELVGQDR